MLSNGRFVYSRIESIPVDDSQKKTNRDAVEPVSMSLKVFDRYKLKYKSFLRRAQETKEYSIDMSIIVIRIAIA
jgi:hypothetical protein